MDRTLVGDLHAFRALLGRQIANQPDPALENINLSVFGLAGFAVGRVDLVVTDLDLHMI